jgi:hypothetical protein
VISLLQDRLNKPHFQFYCGVWRCMTRFEGPHRLLFRAGFGYTVQEAWDDWKRQA